MSAFLKTSGECERATVRARDGATVRARDGATARALARDGTTVRSRDCDWVLQHAHALMRATTSGDLVRTRPPWGGTLGWALGNEWPASSWVSGCVAGCASALQSDPFRYCPD